MNDGELIAKRLSYLTSKQNISINKLAKISGMSQSTLGSLLDGTSKRPTISTIRTVCSGLGISVQYFFDFSPYNESEK